MRKPVRLFTRKNASSHHSFWQTIVGYFFLFLLLSIVSVMIWIGWEVSRSFLTSASWPADQSRFNILFLFPVDNEPTQKKLTFVSIGNQDNDSYIVEFPEETEVYALKEYGKIKTAELASVYKNHNDPKEYLISQITLQTGLVPDVTLERYDQDFVIIDKDSAVRFFSPLEWWKNRSQFAFTTQVKIWNILRKKREDQVKNISQELQTTLQEVSDQQKFIRLSDLQNMTSTQLGTGVAVINKTGVSGFGSYIADVLQAQGFRVVHVSSEGVADIQNSTIIVPTQEQEQSSALSNLHHFFPKSPEIIVDSDQIKNFRTEYVIVFGNDYKEYIQSWNFAR